MNEKILNIEFDCQGFTLKGMLHLPDSDCPPLVIGSHGLEGTMDSAKQIVLSRLLVRHQMAFFRFDHRGCGQSQGDFLHDTSLEKRTRDFIAAVRHVTGLNKTSKNLAVFGSSMGGATCINAWENLLQMDLNLCGGIFCSAPVKSQTITNIPLAANGTRPALPLSFFETNLLFDITPKIQQLKNILIFHGDLDDIVPVSNAHLIYQHANDPRRLVIHPGGDHQMTCRDHQRDFEHQTVEWLLRCFSDSHQSSPQQFQSHGGKHGLVPGPLTK